MSRGPKYNVGDEVEFSSNKARVIKVHTHQYFFGTDSEYYLYDIEYLAGGVCESVSEAALWPLTRNPENATVESKQPKKRLCECGAWAIHWATENHSHWCPAAPRKFDNSNFESEGDYE